MAIPLENSITATLDLMVEVNTHDEQHPITEINMTFYKDYDADYFINKVGLLGSIIAKPKPIQDHLRSGYKTGKITVGKGDITQKWLVDYAKREIVTNSYHCIESFFRLFFAHIEEPECPWIGVEQLQNFTQFKDRINKLRQRTYFKDDHDESVATVLLGKRDMYPKLSDEEWKNNVKRTVELVDRIASDILSNQDYNVYKHGAALLNTKFGFSLGDGSVLKADSQDSFMYLSSQTTKASGKTIKQFSRTFKFMKWEERFATTILTTHLITNLLGIRKMQLGLSKSVRIRTFHTYDFHQMLSSGIIPTTISESLFERHYSKSHRKH